MIQYDNPTALHREDVLNTNAHAVWDPKWQVVLRSAPWQEWIEDDVVPEPEPEAPPGEPEEDDSDKKKKKKK